MTKLIGATTPGELAVELADVLSNLTNDEQAALNSAVADAIQTAVAEAVATIDEGVL